MSPRRARGRALGGYTPRSCLRQGLYVARVARVAVARVDHQRMALSPNAASTEDVGYWTGLAPGRYI